MHSQIRHIQERWRRCRRCPISSTRRSVVLGGDGFVGRGSVDRDGYSIYFRGEPNGPKPTPTFLTPPESPLLLFIGEAPGQSEDITGLPFHGRAGQIFNFTLSLCKTSFRFHITNLVACRPTHLNKKGQVTNRQPTKEEIETCLPRFEDILYSSISPRYQGVIHLGSLSKENLKIPDIPSEQLIHPAFIARMEYKLYEIKRCAARIDHLVQEIKQ